MNGDDIKTISANVTAGIKGHLDEKLSSIYKRQNQTDREVHEIQGELRGIPNAIVVGVTKGIEAHEERSHPGVNWVNALGAVTAFIAVLGFIVMLVIQFSGG